MTALPVTHVVAQATAAPVRGTRPPEHAHLGPLTPLQPLGWAPKKH